MDRATKAAIVIFVVVVFLMLMLAAYGYFGGTWDSAPT
jgi:hypothetical protein